jgi:predicted GNAT family acetyltransferase
MPDHRQCPTQYRWQDALMDVRVADHPDRQRYEATTSDGRLAGFAAYQLAGSQLTMTHTEVDAAFEGHGVGSTLIRGALDDARARGLAVVPLCPFVQAFLAKHPDYQDLVAKGQG